MYNVMNLRCVLKIMRKRQNFWFFIKSGVCINHRWNIYSKLPLTMSLWQRDIRQSSAEAPLRVCPTGSLDKDGYVIANLYDPENISVFKVSAGAEYRIRDYLVTVEKLDERNLVVAVQGG